MLSDSDCNSEKRSLSGGRFFCYNVRMKKRLTVLLLVALFVTSVFASFSGSAKITFGSDLDARTWGFEDLATAKFVFEFAFDTLDFTKDTHETDLWAEFAFAGFVESYESLKIATDTPVWNLDKVSKEDEVGILAMFLINVANIHIYDFTFGILNAGTGADYAFSYYMDEFAMPENDTLFGPDKLVPGFTLGYKGWNGGFGFAGSTALDKFRFAVMAHGESKKYKFGADDAIYAQAGGYIWYYNDVRVGAPLKNAGGALQTGYSSDSFKANLAADLQIVRDDGKNIFEYEVSADATYVINESGKAGLNVYATPGILTSSARYYYDDKDTVKLDAKLWASYKFDFNGTELSTEAHVDARDIFNHMREIELYAKESLKVMEGKIALVFSESYKIFAEELTLTAKVTYKHEKFETWAALKDLTYSFEEKTISALKVECGIKSEAIIENAEIGLSYKKADFARKEDGSVTKLGTVEAYASISF